MSEEFEEELRDIEALCREILADTGTEQKHLEHVDRDAWSALEEAGLTELAAGFDDESPEIGLRRAFTVLREVGGNTSAMPVAEHDLLSSWIAQEVGTTFDSAQTRTVAILADDGSGTAPWVRDVDTVLVVGSTSQGGSAAWEVNASTVSIEEGFSDSGAYSRIRIPNASNDAIVLERDLRPQLRLVGALARCVMMAGAAKRIVDLTVEHITTREQFGRPISKFQAVQNLLADIASEASLMDAVANAAVSTFVARGAADPSTEFAIAAAASCGGHAAAPVVRNAHQLLGAMGYTREHQLHKFTNRLLQWRSEYGSLTYWDDQVLQAAKGADQGKLWPVLVNG